MLFEAGSFAHPRETPSEPRSSGISRRPRRVRFVVLPRGAPGSFRRSAARRAGFL
jgi:hypothetical protein